MTPHNKKPLTLQDAEAAVNKVILLKHSSLLRKHIADTNARDNFSRSAAKAFSERMKQEKTGVTLSASTICGLVKQQGLEKLLPCGGKKYKRR